MNTKIIASTKNLIAALEQVEKIINTKSSVYLLRPQGRMPASLHPVPTEHHQREKRDIRRSPGRRVPLPPV